MHLEYRKLSEEILLWLPIWLIVKIVFSGYLKSTSDIKILEGETCVIEWLAYNNEEHTPPCSWWYAAEKSKEALTFLAYKNGKTYIYGRDNQWHFTNITNPCAGGLTKKMINIEDAGVYTMQTENGNLLRKEEAETLVEVLKGKLDSPPIWIHVIKITTHQQYVNAIFV